MRTTRRHTARVLLLLALLASLAAGPISPPALAQQVIPEAAADQLRWPFNDPRATRHWPRSRGYDLEHVKAELGFDWEKQEVAGTATLTLAPLNDGLTHLAVDAADMKIETVTLVTAGTPPRTLEFSHHEDKLIIVLDHAYASGQPLTVAIAYRARPRKGLYFFAPDAAYPNRPIQLWTQGEADYNHHWLPLYDAPNDKATSELIATVPAEMTAISNGTLVSERANGDGSRTFHWREDVPHSTYLISLVAGHFDRHDGKTGAPAEKFSGALPLPVYVPPGTDRATVERSFAQTGAMVEFFSDYIALPFPFEKYAQVTVEDFLWGGMENSSATTLYTDTLHDEAAEPNFSSEALVAHELAHSWWGNLVTCRDWPHIWLNESFATFFTNLWIEHRYGRDTYDYQRWLNARDYFKEEREEYRRPIVWPVYVDSMDVFDGHTYPKGALVLAMLRAELGDVLFQKALRHYGKKFSRQVADTEDFRKAITEATGKELGWFFEQWLYRAGHPELHVEYDWNEETHSAHVVVEQRQPRTELTPLFRLPVEIEFLTGQSPQRFRVVLEEARHDLYFPLPERPTRVRFDPDQRLLKTLSFPKSREELIELLREDSNVIGRIWAAEQLAGAGTDLVALGALRQALREDYFYGVRREVARALGQTRSAVARDALIEALRDPDPRVREATAEALGEFHDDAVAAGALKQILEGEKKSYVVAAAAKALGKTRNEDAFEALQAALGRDSHVEVIRRGAFEGFGELNDARAVPLLLEWSSYGRPPRAREMAIEALGKVGRDNQEVFQRLLALLSDPYRWARRAALRALGELGDARALDTLEALAAAEPERRLQREAEQAIRKIRRRQAAQQTTQELQSELEQLKQEVKTLRKKTPPF